MSRDPIQGDFTISQAWESYRQEFHPAEPGNSPVLEESRKAFWVAATLMVLQMNSIVRDKIATEHKLRKIKRLVAEAFDYATKQMTGATGNERSQGC